MPSVAAPIEGVRLRRGLGDASARWTGRVIAALAVVFLLVPAVLTIVMSFSAGTNFAFPPQEWGTRQYEELFTNSKWIGHLGTSIGIAIPAAIISTVVAIPTALALNRTALRGKGALRFLSLSSLIIPLSGYAVALYGVFVDLHLLGRWYGMALAHSLLGYPIVVLVLDAGLRRISPTLELAAMSLGASRRRAWTGITLRLLVPAIAAGFFLAFMSSLDEAVFVNFLGAGQIETLPKAIFDSVRFGIDPVITAIASLFIVLTTVLAIATIAVLGGNDERR